MNRNQEYFEWMEELEKNIPDLQKSITKAGHRRKRLLSVYRSLASVAACFAIFVLMVNFCTPVAYACSKVPVLKELAAAVTFSRSLSDAVENEYVQPMYLTQVQNGVTAEIAYLIVDQKQVNVFYRLDSDSYEKMEADPEVLTADGTRPESCCYGSDTFGVANGELRSLNIDYMDGTVPESLRVQLKVYDNAVSYEEPIGHENNVDEWEIFEGKTEYIAEFDFLLEFDPEFTAAGKIVPVNQIVEMDGQKITISQIEVYPTHMRVAIEDHPDNTAWLTSLAFYIETDEGMRFEPVSNGTTATGTADTPTMTSYRADSTYFYEAEHLKLVITGAQWLNKDMEKIKVNLITGETESLPAGISFESAKKSGEMWVVTFRADYTDGKPMYQIFGNLFYDADGNEYEINTWSSRYGEENENGEITYFLEQFPLRGYPYDEVWLSPHFSHNWVAEDEIIVPIQ